MTSSSQQKKNSPKRINESQLQMLEALNTYRFLSVKQCIRLGIANTKYSVSKNVIALTAGRKPLLGVADFGTFPDIGRLPRLYYLSKHGASWLAEAFSVDEADINYPKGVKIFTRDYFHRVMTIDLHIALQRFAQSISDLSLDFYHTYFEHTGANHSHNPKQSRLQSLTTVSLKDGYRFKPDVIFRLTDPHKKHWLFTAEIYRNHTTKRTYQQLERHAQCLIDGALSNSYQYDRAVRVLIVCEQENAMKALIKRVRNEPKFKPLESLFLFKTDAQVKEDVVKQWQTFTGKTLNIFEAL